MNSSIPGNYAGNSFAGFAGNLQSHELNEHGTIAGGVYEEWHNNYESWLDEEGLATGALAWAEQHLPINGQHYYFDTSHIERDKKSVAEGYVTRTQKRGHPPVTEINYQVGWKKFVKITDFEMTVGPMRGEKNAQRTYRPFKQQDGTIKFRLVHEKVDRAYNYNDALPAYVNYLLVCAKRALRESIDHDVCHYHAVLPILERVKPLSRFNHVPVCSKLTLLYQTFLGALSGSREEAKDAALALVVGAEVATLKFKAACKT